MQSHAPHPNEHLEDTGLVCPSKWPKRYSLGLPEFLKVISGECGDLRNDRARHRVPSLARSCLLTFYCFLASKVSVLPASVSMPKTSAPPPTVAKLKCAAMLASVKVPLQSEFTV